MLIHQSDITTYWNLSPFIIKGLIKDEIIKPRISRGQQKHFNYHDLVKQLGPPLQVTELIIELQKLADKKEIA